MATRGVLGGLSRAAWLAVRILSVWSFDWVLIETAGVGQSEIDVVDLAETTLLVLSPAVGDDVQVMKAGIMEVANLFVINKADLPGAERMRNSLRSVLERNGTSDERLQSDDEPDSHHMGVAGGTESAGPAGTADAWGLTPDGRAIFETVANEARPKSGVPELAEALAERSAALQETDRLEAFRTRRHRVEIRRLALSLLGTAVDGELDAADVSASPVTDPLETARRIVQELVKNETWRQIDVHTG
jgi:LAO/AO transport system kinase